MKQNIQIYIDNFRVDTSDDLSISIKKQFKDIKEFSKRKTSFSKPIKILHTPNNAKLFGEMFNINEIGGWDKSSTPLASLIINGENTLTGKCKLSAINKDSYEIVMYKESSNLDTLFGDELITNNVNSDKDITYTTDYSVDINRTNIRAEYLNKAPRYDGKGINMGWLKYDTSTELLYDYQNDGIFYPSVAVRELFEECLKSIGKTVTFSPTILGYLNHMYLPYNGSTDDLSTSREYAQYHFDTPEINGRLERTITTPHTTIVEQVLPEYFLNGWRVTVDERTGQPVNTPISDFKLPTLQTGRYKLNARIGLARKHNTGEEAVEYKPKFMLINNAGIDSLTFDYKRTDIIYEDRGLVVDDAGDNGQFEVIIDVPSTGYNFAIGFDNPIISRDDDGNITNELITDVTGGSTFVKFTKVHNYYIGDNTLNVNQLLPIEYKKKDFVNDVLTMFNSFVEETDDELNISTFDDFYGGKPNVYDLTSKLESNSINIKPISTQVLEVPSFSMGESEDIYSEDHKDKFDTGIYDSIAPKTSKKIVNKSLKFVDTVCFNSTDTDALATILNDYKKFKPRILFIQHKNITGHFGLDTINNTAITILPTYSNRFNLDINAVDNLILAFDVNRTYNNNGNITEVNSTIINKFYGSEITELNNTDLNIVKANINITSTDFANIRFNDYIYLDMGKNGGGYYRLNSINNYNPSVDKLTEVELIQLSDTKVTAFGFDLTKTLEITAVTEDEESTSTGTTSTSGTSTGGGLTLAQVNNIVDAAVEPKLDKTGKAADSDKLDGHDSDEFVKKGESTVYIEDYEGVDFGEKLQAAINDSIVGGIINCYSATGEQNMTSSIDITTPCTILLGAIKLSMNNGLTSNMFNILANSVTIKGLGRSSKQSLITAPTSLRMLNAAAYDSLNGYHFHSRGYNVITIDGMDLIGVESEKGHQLNNIDYPLEGSGGIYMEKANPEITSAGNNINQVVISNIFMDGTKANGIYLDTPILSILKNIRISNCAGNGIFILGGTSTSMSNIYVSSSFMCGFHTFGTTYASLMNCVAENCGIGFWFRSSFNISCFSAGCEELRNIGSSPWRHSRLITGEDGLNLHTTSSTGTIIPISDTSSDYLGEFRGTGYFVSGGKNLSLYTPYCTNPGNSTVTTQYTGGTGKSANTRFVKIAGNCRNSSVINSGLSYSSSVVGINRFDIEIESEAENINLEWNPETLGTVTPAVVGEYITDDDSQAAPLLLQSPTTLVKSGNKIFTDFVLDTKNNIVSDNFTSGLLGDGFKFGTEAECDSLLIRDSLIVNTFINNKINIQNGDMIVSDSAKIKRITTLGRLVTDENIFVVGDKLRCSKNLGETYYFDITAVEVLIDEYAYTGTLSSTGTPEVGDLLVRWNSTDPTRQGILYLSGLGEYYDVIHNEEIKARFGNLSTLGDDVVAKFGDLTGKYGLYGKDALLEDVKIVGGGINMNDNFIVDESGLMRAENANIKGNIEAETGNIGDLSIIDSKLKGETDDTLLEIDADGKIGLTDKDSGRTIQLSSKEIGSLEDTEDLMKITAGAILNNNLTVVSKASRTPITCYGKNDGSSTPIYRMTRTEADEKVITLKAGVEYSINMLSPAIDVTMSSTSSNFLSAPSRYYSMYIDYKVEIITTGGTVLYLAESEVPIGASKYWNTPDVYTVTKSIELPNGTYTPTIDRDVIIKVKTYLYGAGVIVNPDNSETTKNLYVYTSAPYLSIYGGDVKSFIAPDGAVFSIDKDHYFKINANSTGAEDFVEMHWGTDVYGLQQKNTATTYTNTMITTSGENIARGYSVILMRLPADGVVYLPSLENLKDGTVIEVVNTNNNNCWVNPTADAPMNQANGTVVVTGNGRLLDNGNESVKFINFIGVWYTMGRADTI